MTYLSSAQVEQLLKAIHPQRVSQRDGMSHLEAYDVRAHLNRIFGFARWSADLTDLTPLYETLTEKASKSGTGTYEVVSVGYRATMRLTIHAPDGTVLATYTEAAAGSATNFPINKRSDATDFAIKTAESQALKRCVTNLGDQFGLSLYQKGSRDPLVKRTLLMPEGDSNTEPVDHDIHPVTPEAGEEVSAPPSVESTSPLTPAVPPAAVSPAAPVSTSPDVLAQQEAQQAKNFRDALIAAHKRGRSGIPELGRINTAVVRARLKSAPCTKENGESTTLELLFDDLLSSLSKAVA